MTNKVIEFKIDYADWKLIIVPANEMDTEYSEFGICNSKAQIIKLSDGIPPSNFKHVLRHELTHAFIYTHSRKQESYSEEDLAIFVEMYGYDIVILTNNLMWRLNNG